MNFIPAKIGIPLLLAASVGLLSASGTLAPFVQKAAQLATQLRSAVAPAAGKTAGATTKAPAIADAASAPPPSAGQAGKAAAPAAAKAKPVPLESLLLPVPLPDKGSFALQVGQFENAADADALGARLKRLELPFDKVLDAVDQNGKSWSIVPVGPYASIDAARTARLSVARALGVETALPVILLPPPKPGS